MGKRKDSYNQGVIAGLILAKKLRRHKKLKGGNLNVKFALAALTSPETAAYLLAHKKKK